MLTSVEFITYFDHQFKNEVLKDIVEDDSIVDDGILYLVNAINKVPYFITMNSCQGCLIPEEADEHCPKTYVDFYVIHHEYWAANKLFVELINKFGCQIECKLNYEADFDFIGENEIEDNGMINMRFGIEVLDPDVYEELVEYVEEFSKRIK